MWSFVANPAGLPEACCWSSVAPQLQRVALRPIRHSTRQGHQPSLISCSLQIASQASRPTREITTPSVSNPIAASTSRVSLRHDPQQPPQRLQLKGLTFQELEKWCGAIGEKPQRALQVWRLLYADAQRLPSCWEDLLGVQGGISQSFYDKVRDCTTLDGGLALQHVTQARDGTRKLVFKLTSGEGTGGLVEAVLIPVAQEKGFRPRLTLCVSSQVGCAMNCQFCYTGRMGLLGNLSTAQIVEQLVAARRVLAECGDPTPLNNVVFMGMGEPMHNLDAVLAAVSIMNDRLGLAISHNKITVSTVGLVPEMERFVATCTSAQLALSLHASNDEVRDWVAPVNRRYDLATLTASLERMFPRGHPGRRRVLIEYVMLRGVNDSVADAEQLVRLLERVEAKVNLIVFNPHKGTRFQPSTDEALVAFRGVLVNAGRVCTIRDSRGDDEMAACGQLGNLGVASRAAPILEPPERFRAALLGATV